MNTFTKYLVTLLIGFLLGWWAHWAVTKPEPVAMIHAPAVPLAEGGLQLESTPGAKVSPAQDLPAGAEVFHIGQIKAKARPVAGRVGRKEGAPAKDGTKDGPLQLAALDCPPMTIDYTLYRGEGGQPFMRTSTPDGVITGGFDAPVAGFELEPDRSWAFGAGRGPDGRLGVRVDRDFSWAPLRVGLDLQQSADHRIDPWVWALLRF